MIHIRYFLKTRDFIIFDFSHFRVWVFGVLHCAEHKME